MTPRVEPVDPIVIAETDNFVVWTSDDEFDITYHIELGGITLHATSEEWGDFVILVDSVIKESSDTEGFSIWITEEDDSTIYHVELGGVTLHLSAEEWHEISALIKSAI